jgi:molecular chaperone DnaK
MLQDLSGIVPDRSVHPDEAVARGAAIFAAKSLSGGDHAVALVDCRVIDVNSHSLGVQGVEVKTGRRINRVILAKNTALPACVTKKFVTTKPGQRSLMVQILEGESRQPSECSVVGTTIVRDLPPHLPQGSPVQITFQYARNGRLSVSVNVPGANQETHLVLECAGARGPGQISQWRQVVTAETGLAAFVQTANQEAAAASVPGAANGGA